MLGKYIPATRQSLFLGLKLFAVTPAIFEPGSKLFKNMDSRLLISGMTNDVDA